ncbi:MAG TPA: AlpA family phage regulatory protein [Rhizomicrobium sp.]|nr:AlpA family phage regulatory protein [Rhizomicrobium sp.]
MRNWVSKLMHKRTSLALEDQSSAFKDARIQARRQELLIMYGQVRSAVQALAVQNANTLELENDIQAEFGAKAAKQLFPKLSFPLHTSPDQWMRNIDEQLFGHAGSLPCATHDAGDLPVKNLSISTKSSGQRTSRGKRPINPDLLTAEQACEMFGGITVAGLYKGIKEKRFPKPIKIGPHTARWLRSECNDTLRRFAEARSHPRGSNGSQDS